MLFLDFSLKNDNNCRNTDVFKMTDKDSVHARLSSHQEACSYQKKIKGHRKCVQKEPTIQRYLLILELATKIIGQSKAFYRQRIPESSCASKETVGIDILVTSRNVDRKIMQSVRIESRFPSRIRKWKLFSQFQRTSTKVIPTEKT